MKHISLRLPDDVHTALVEAARHDERSLNAQIIWILRRHLVIAPEVPEAPPV